MFFILFFLFNYFNIFFLQAKPNTSKRDAEKIRDYLAEEYEESDIYTKDTEEEEPIERPTKKVIARRASLIFLIYFYMFFIYFKQKAVSELDIESETEISETFVSNSRFEALCQSVEDIKTNQSKLDVIYENIIKKQKKNEAKEEWPVELVNIFYIF